MCVRFVERSERNKLSETPTPHHRRHRDGDCGYVHNRKRSKNSGLCVSAELPSANTFPDDEGIYKGFYVSRTGLSGGEQTLELQDSDIVCFRSALTDADGYHSLVPVGEGSYDMPPFATVTLEKVEEPGEWEANGHKVQRRLFTVRVTYK